MAARAVQNQDDKGDHSGDNKGNLVVLSNSVHDQSTAIGEVSSTGITSETISHVTTALQAILEGLPSLSGIRRLHELDGDVIDGANNRVLLTTSLHGEEGDSQHHGDNNTEDAANSNNESIDEEEASTAGSTETDDREDD